ncbi:Gfo/Idh/MocA family protein [Phenylobacterium kunshanense]|uniref:Gfo/Idh/MocA family oxidoreductase n=1 Tax=Phenylobacterium kunshanense TaxID=1445034 RepID=A0A328BHS3_9CAUL|nr:Gfo/Idh/MocA family oxidoreductase [Phenylobacterium kunshanense]RAK66497.1 gfo/Idh/MocA family oxidoreductase [Phenylobacterium kunshanense]
MSGADRINVAVVGLGKMGVSHLAIANATQGLKVTAVCDSFAMLGNMVEKHCGLTYVPDYAEAIAQPGLQAVIIATPTRFHDSMIREALARGLHVFCEKPLTLSAAVSDELAGEGVRRGLVCQAGYHNRFVGTFAEAKRLLASGAIGKIRHVHAESYGPVVLKPVGKTWRSQSSEGGGCLYDYAAHPINLMNWYVGRPVECIGADLTKQYSADVEDAVYANLRFHDGVTGQVSVNWSDETMRKMTTRITVWGDEGKISADRQELQVYLKGDPPPGYNKGWTVRYITDLTPPIGYYLRGEEYSAQMEGFAAAAAASSSDYVNDFRSAAETDYTLELIRARAFAEPPAAAAMGAPAPAPRQRGLLARVLGR